MKLRINTKKFRVNHGRDTPLRGVYIPKLRKIFGFCGFDTPRKMKFGLKVSNFDRLLQAKFNAMTAMCHPCGAKNLRVAPE